VGTTIRRKLCITHPFHPLAGRKIDFVSRRQYWGRIGLFIWTSVVGFGGLPRLGRISIQRTIFTQLPRAARRFEQSTCWS
jgi:hypothetical protein